MEDKIDIKYEKLKDYLKSLKSAVVAYSAGVDSTFLLKTAQNVLKDNLVAITVLSPFFPKKELDEALSFCKRNKINHKIIKFNPLTIKEIKDNPKNRCYYCKKNIFKKIIEVANKSGIKNILEGSNTDDMKDYRPGMAAIEELKIKSPLKYAELSKNEIRKLSEKLNLKTANKPSLACLASRIPYNEIITKEKLSTIEKSENFLFDLGFNNLRVRFHSDIARIEISENDFEKIIKKNTREKIYEKLKEFGFNYVSLDLKGYRTGSLNETIK